MSKPENRSAASGKTLSPLGMRIEQLLDGREKIWLSKRAGLSGSTLHDLMVRTSPGADKVLKVAQALGTTVEYLMTGEGAPPAPLPGVAEPVTEFRQPSDAAIRSFTGRHEAANRQLEEATQAVRVIPDEVLRMTLVRIIARYGVEIEDIADILTSKARKAT